MGILKTHFSKFRSAGKGRLQVFVLVATGLLAGVVCVRAVNGRDFSGTYDVSSVSQSGDTCTLTFSARVFNYSGNDVTSATLNLGDSAIPGQSYANFQELDIPSRGSVLVSSSVTLPAREFQSWQRGGSPCLTIQFTDTSGNNRLETVELIRGQVEEGQ